MTATAPIMDLNECNSIYNDYWFDESRHLVMQGGAGSGKSYFCADKCILWMATEAGHRVGVFRKVARTIKRSVFQLIRDRLSYWGFLPFCELNRTDFTIKFMNGSEIWCVGLDDQEKLKSITGLSAAWVEEATEFTPDDLTQINLRIRGETPGYKQIIYSFNPISIMHHLKGRFYDTPPDSFTLLQTTYRDNEYIDADYIKEIEDLQRTSPHLYKVYGLGEWGVLKGLIYGSFDYVDYPDGFDDICYGLDFGYNHPMALVGVSFRDGDAYLTEKIYESGLTTNDLIKRMGELNIPKDAMIYCDAAEPDRIEELQRAGYTVTPAYKGAGSVRAGIDFCQGINIYTKPDNININKESQSYSWRTTRDGSPMDEPVKLHDDAMDAMRYAIYTHIGKPTAELFTFERSQLGF